MDQPPAIPPTQPHTQQKKGMPAIAWVGIGCGGLLLIAIIAGVFIFNRMADTFKDFAENPEKAGAEMMVSLNPDIQLISQDDEKGEMTIRTKDGKEATLTYKEIAEGKLAVTDEEGNETAVGSGDLSEVPGWVPKPSDFSDGVSTFHKDVEGRVSGQFSGKSGQDGGGLKKFFEEAASGLGMDTSSSSSTSLDGTSATTLKFSGNEKSLTIVITERADSAALVNITYSEG